MARPGAGRDGGALVAGLGDDSLPLVRLPGGTELLAPSVGEVSRVLGIGRVLAPREEVDLLVVGGGPAGLAAAVYGASEGLETLVIEGTALGGQAGASRRIENYLGFPAGITGVELTSRAVVQARKFNARVASPYRAVSLEPVDGRYLVRLEDDHDIVADSVLLATGADYRRLPVDRLAEYEGLTVFYAAGPPEAQLCGAARVGVVGGGNSAAQAAIWLARGGALVTLLHRRADLRETMSDYLIHDLERYGVAVRDRSEIAALHGEDGRLAAVTLTNGERLPFSFLFLFLGAAPCTEWLGESVSATNTVSSVPARRRTPSTCSRRACPASSPPETSDRDRRSAVPPPSARARWPCSSSTPAARRDRRRRPPQPPDRRIRLSPNARLRRQAAGSFHMTGRPKWPGVPVDEPSPESADRSTWPTSSRSRSTGSAWSPGRSIAESRNRGRVRGCGRRHLRHYPE